VAFSPDGAVLATACQDDGEVKLWNAQDGKPVRTLGRGPGFVQVTFSPKGTWLSAVGTDQSVWLWTLKGPQARRVLRGHTQPVNCLAFSPDERQLVTGSQDTRLILWDVRTGLEIGTYRGHAGVIGAVAFSPDGKRLASLGGDGLKNWDPVRSLDFVSLEQGYGGWDAAISRDGRRVAAATRDSGVHLWDAETGQELWTLSYNRKPAPPWAVAFSPDGKSLAVALGTVAQGAVVIVDAGTGKVSRLLTDPPLAAACDAVAFSPDGKRLVAGTQERVVRVWDVASGKEVLKLGGHGLTVSDVVFSRDGRRIASMSGGYLWGAPIKPQPNPLNLLDDSDRKAVPNLKIWDAATGQELLTVGLPRIQTPPITRFFSFGKGPTGTMRFPKAQSLAISPDGKVIAIGSPSNEVRLISATNGKELRVLKGHALMPRTFAFSPDARRLVSGSVDGTIRIWDVATGQVILTLRQRGGIRSLVFSDDGQKIVAAGDNAVRVWDATPLTEAKKSGKIKD
jgi:WD40 repeat protein